MGGEQPSLQVASLIFDLVIVRHVHVRLRTPQRISESKYPENGTTDPPVIPHKRGHFRPRADAGSSAKVPQAQYLVASPHFVLDPGSTSGERPSIVRDDGSPEPKSAQLLFGES